MVLVVVRAAVVRADGTVVRINRDQRLGQVRGLVLHHAGHGFLRLFLGVGVDRGDDGVSLGLQLLLRVALTLQFGVHLTFDEGLGASYAFWLGLLDRDHVWVH